MMTRNGAPAVLLLSSILSSVGACDRAVPQQSETNRPPATTAAIQDPAQRLDRILARRIELAESVQSPAAERFRAIAAELEQRGPDAIAGQARLYMPWLRESDVPGASALFVQYFAGLGFAPVAVEFLDERGQIVATAPTGVMEVSDDVGAGMRDFVTVVYVVPSPHATDDVAAAARLLERGVTPDGRKVAAVHLIAPPERLSVRVRSADGTMSDTVPISVAPRIK
jgi:hypothetical protein